MSNSDAGTDTGFQLRSKDEVECNDVVKYDDTGTLAGAKYHRWELGSVREDDALYITELLPGPASTHNIEQIRAALTRAPSENIFPQLPIPWFFERTGVTVHDSYDTEPDPAVYYLKRPWLAGYDAERAAAVNRPDQVAIWFAHEIKALEHLARCDPHPNIVRYHGCRMRRGRVTGIMLGRVPGDTIQNHLKAGKKIKNRRAFFKALTSAVTYLHDVVSLAHNDIQPTNVMVSPDGTTPTLIDFNSALPDGEEMMLCSIHSCWGNDPLDMVPETYFNGPMGAHPTSRKSRDLAALDRLRTRIDNPEFGPRSLAIQEGREFFEAGRRLGNEARERIAAKMRESNAESD